ncbi:MAG: GNAT family N-acetyltransferase [Flavobacteriaceae bacterium]|nr:GNAT family N-acetyltransferase [Flavobacteriaceae bacterium]
MIEKVNCKEEEVAQQLYSIWQASYPIEKEMIGAEVFPPLDRTVLDFQSTENVFYAYIVNDEFAGVIEVARIEDYIHLQSLVVHPAHFRKGIASALIKHAIKTHVSAKYSVETGFENVPAKRLYESFAFKETKVYDTGYGVKKIRFELKL